jgi:hypothetical protein
MSSGAQCPISFSLSSPNKRFGQKLIMGRGTTLLSHDKLKHIGHLGLQPRVALRKLHNFVYITFEWWALDPMRLEELPGI